MQDFRQLIRDMKKYRFEQAESISIRVVNARGRLIGSLIPVGKWILEDDDKVRLISAWRQKFMRMFLTQFVSSHDRTLRYLEDLSIAQEGRILFLVYDEGRRFVGHMGMADIDGHGGELDNVMRGVEGGDPRLIYFAEVALLNWCFSHLGLVQSEVRVLSYNWMVTALHEEVGYTVIDQIPLLRAEREGMTFHDIARDVEPNVKYSCIRMSLHRDELYARAGWIRSLPSPASTVPDNDFPAA